MSTLLRQLKGESQRYTNMASYGLGKLLGSAAERIAELELSHKDLIEEFAEASCMGDLAKIARNYGYEESKDE
jgi:hypothetical protein